MERHLVIADQAYKMAELKNMTLYEAKRLPTVRDDVKIKVKESYKSKLILNITTIFFFKLKTLINIISKTYERGLHG